MYLFPNVTKLNVPVETRHQIDWKYQNKGWWKKIQSWCKYVAAVDQICPPFCHAFQLFPIKRSDYSTNKLLERRGNQFGSNMTDDILLAWARKKKMFSRDPRRTGVFFYSSYSRIYRSVFSLSVYFHVRPACNRITQEVRILDRILQLEASEQILL